MAQPSSGLGGAGVAGEAAPLLDRTRGAQPRSIPLEASKISPKTEAVVRITLACLVAYILSVADLPTAIPPTMKQLVGILSPAICFTIPHLVFILGATYPTIICATVFALLGATALLAAATVSDGLFVTTFATWALWCTALGYGPDAKSTTSMTGLLISVGGLISLGSWQFVQGGITATISESSLGQEGGFLAELVKSMLEAHCGNDPDCWEGIGPGLSEPIPVTIPGDWDFAGQTAFLSFTHEGAQILVPGGLWIVKGFWQWSGLINPVAVMRNLLIILLWSLLVVAFGRILPPIRTARRLFTRSILPAAITGAAAKIKDSYEEGRSGEGKEQAPPAEEEKKQVRREEKLIQLEARLSGGGLSPLTAFEPRLCRNPLECTWPTLKNLDGGVQDIILYALASDLWEKFSETEMKDIGAEVGKDLEVLGKCAKALMDDDEYLVANRAEQKDIDDEKDVESARPYFARTLSSITEKLRESTDAWLSAMHHPKYTGAKSAVVSYLPWAMGIVIFLKRMFVSLMLPFRPSAWNVVSFLAAAKFVLGITILVVMEVYWVDYRCFAIASPTVSIPRGPVTVTISETPNLFSGWNLIAYVFATASTTEGTVKKGILRAVGTAVGGISAWIAIIVCSGSYDQDAAVNLYGLVAWLTVTTGIAAYLFFPGGPMAMMGVNPDNGAYGTYYVSTQALCALQVALGIGERDAIIANRIAATVSGVIIAMIVALIPPQVRGADPKRQLEMLDTFREALKDGISLLSVGGQGTGAKIEEVKLAFLAKAEQQRNDTQFLLKDADKLQNFCLFKVDPRLQQVLDCVAVTGAYIYEWLTFASQAADDKAEKMSEMERESFNTEVNSIVKRLEPKTQGSGEKLSPTPQTYRTIGSKHEEMKVLLAAGSIICEIIENHESMLSPIP